MRRRDAAAAIVVAALAACLVACGPPGPRSPDTVARIGGESVEHGEFRAFLRRQAGPEVSDLGAAVLSRLFDQFLSERLLLRLALDRGVLETGEEATPRRAAEALLAASEPAAISREEIERYYVEHAAGFVLPERVRLRHLVTHDRESAESARQRILEGEDFRVVAREVSTAPSAVQGGLEGEVTIAQLPFPFARAIGGTGEGEMTEVIEAAAGFHLFLVEARLPQTTVGLDAAAETIRERLEQRRTDRRLAALVADARRRYTVVVYEENLPFPYRGSFATPSATGE